MTMSMQDASLGSDLDTPQLGFRSGNNTDSHTSSTFFGTQQAISQMLPLVRVLARKMQSQLPGHVELEELISAGVLGLCEAGSRFRGNTQDQFKHYAQHRIRGAMVDLLRSTDLGSRELRCQARKIREAREALLRKQVWHPTEQDLADEMGIDLTTYRQITKDLACLQVNSLHEKLTDGEEGEVIDLLAASDEEGPMKLYLQKETKDLLVKAIDQLPEKERLVLSLYYHEELTMLEIAGIMQVGQSRISQLHSSAIKCLQDMLAVGAKVV